MHWSDEIAERIIQRNPNKEEYVCAAGVSPSGSVHIGNFRDLATPLFVVKALKKRGKKAKLLISWDEFDRCRKIPANVQAVVGNAYDKYIGCPYVDIPDPWGCHESYAAHFEEEFLKGIEPFGIELDCRYQAKMYRSGAYTKDIIESLQKRGEIFEILDSFKTKDASKSEEQLKAEHDAEKAAYYPATIFCPECHTDFTTITSLSEDCTEAEYTCRCGHSGHFNFLENHDCKLGWKIDWAMRWRYENVDFEPGGKDHSAPTGSYNNSKLIAKRIFGHEAPIYQGYEFIGIKGMTGKMSSSSGLNLTPETLLKLYQPEVLLWLYAKTDPIKAFDICFDDGILRQYFEFDKMLNDCREGKAPEISQDIIYNCTVEGREIATVPMSLLVQLGSVVNFNVPMLETVFEKIGMNYKEADFADRLHRAKFWLEQCAPDQVNKLRVTRNFDVYNSLTDEEKKEIELLHAYIAKGGYTLDELNSELYAIPKAVYGTEMTDKELKGIQGAFFRTVYKLLIDKEKGPRLYLFLYAIESEKYVGLLDFSYPQTEEEIKLDTPEETCCEETVEEEIDRTPDEVQPVKEQIEIDDFARMDFRVCKILKAEGVRKSHSCLKLTLDDGLGERVIMSSIKEEYTPEQLVGRKIIVVANLKPNRICNINSQGMLLAATNNACGCKVIFVDDSVPTGTQIK
ncbi:MAG: lysine--tRNA ligase [Clostridia bacterium]|nr:lysine--tRNA ligase [Clostridia bacterium]MBR4013028.1 lysine--tRNA ligase [Clostridia bacterium]